MDCRTARKLIPVWMDGELQPDRAEQLSEHLQSCQACREEVAALRSTMQLLDASKEIEPTFALADVRERGGERNRRPLFGWVPKAQSFATASLVLAALAAGGLSGVYYGAHVGNRGSRTPVAAKQQVSDTFGLKAFDNGLAGAIYVSDADTGQSNEVTQ